MTILDPELLVEAIELYGKATAEAHIVANVEPDMNQVDPMLTIRTFDSERTCDDIEPFARALVAGKTVTFIDKNTDKEIYKCIPNAQVSLGRLFVGKDYLLQILLNTALAELTKKLTPPLSATKTD